METDVSVPLKVEEETVALKQVAQAAPTLSVEAAKARLGPEILQALESKFNGSLTEVRSPDTKDQLF